MSTALSAAREVATVHPLCDAVGAEVRGFDLARIDDADFAFIMAAWDRYSVLLFRDQRLSDTDLVAFSRRYPDPRRQAAAGLADMNGEAVYRTIRYKKMKT